MSLSMSDNGHLFDITPYSPHCTVNNASSITTSVQQNIHVYVSVNLKET